MIWMVVSIASATIPTAALIANMIVVSSIRHAIQNTHNSSLKGSKNGRKRHIMAVNPPWSAAVRI